MHIQVFRQVDRADFMLFPDDQDALEAYEDHAWRRGKLHLSAPCIYTRAVEALHFKRGECNCVFWLSPLPEAYHDRQGLAYVIWLPGSLV